MKLVSGAKPDANAVGNNPNIAVPNSDTSATTLPQPDAAIVEAWERGVAAYFAYNALPHNENDEVDALGYTSEENALWAVMDDAERVIQSSNATSPRGVAIQLWMALCHLTIDREDDAAARRMDIEWFNARDDEFDWSDRLILAALRSLKCMEA